MRISFAEFGPSRTGAIVVGVWEGGELTAPARRLDEESSGADDLQAAGTGMVAAPPVADD